MKSVGNLLFHGSGIVMFIFELTIFHRWWGDVGLLAAILCPPLVAAFPFVYLVKVGLSLLYFGVWAIGLVGLLLIGAGD